VSVIGEGKKSSGSCDQSYAVSNGWNVIGAGRTSLPDGVEGVGLQAKEKVLCLPQGAGNYDVSVPSIELLP
jgi:hypothetical protein